MTAREDVRPADRTLQDKVIAVLRTVYDPEIPVNVYDLGMIYRIDFREATFP